MIKSASRSSITNDQKYRSMLAGTVPSNEYLIETVLVTGSSVPAIEFLNLSQYAGIYKHLQIVYSCRATSANASRPLVINFNGDTTTSYSSHDLFNNGSSVASTGTANMTYSFFGYIASGNAVSGSFGAGVSEILDPFNTNKNKVFRTLSGVSNVDPQIILNSGGFYKTAVINSIRIASFSGNLDVGTRFSIYGVTA